MQSQGHFFPMGTFYTPHSAIELPEGTSINQSALLSSEASSFTTDYNHGDSYTAIFSNGLPPPTTTGNKIYLLQTQRGRFNAAFLEGTRSLFATGPGT